MCLRGLEEHLGGMQRSAKSQKSYFIRGVLREQKRKRLAAHDCEPFFITNAVLVCGHLLSTSSWALKKALARGASDALEVADDDLHTTVVDDNDVPRFDTPHALVAAAMPIRANVAIEPKNKHNLVSSKAITSNSFSNESTRQRTKSQRQHKRWNLVSLQQVHSPLVAPC